MSEAETTIDLPGAGPVTSDDKVGNRSGRKSSERRIVELHQNQPGRKQGRSRPVS